MGDNPVGEAADAVVKGLSDAGETGAIIEFGVLWSGIACLTLTSLTKDATTLAMQVIGGVLCAGGGVPLLFRVGRRWR